MKVIGITGGSGVGKTTALGVLQERFHAAVLDCDALYHQMLAVCQPMLRELRNAFPAVFTGDTPDRKKLGTLVFSDPAALKRLNEITHRYVKQAVADQLAVWQSDGIPLAAVDAFALVESVIAALCDVTVFVSASEENRIRRIMQREGITREYAALRVRAQKQDADFAENADYILENDCCNAAQFQEKCINFFQKLC